MERVSRDEPVDLIWILMEHNGGKPATGEMRSGFARSFEISRACEPPLVSSILVPFRDNLGSECFWVEALRRRSWTLTCRPSTRLSLRGRFPIIRTHTIQPVVHHGLRVGFVGIVMIEAHENRMSLGFVKLVEAGHLF
jgi:hypothetical protein